MKHAYFLVLCLFISFQLWGQEPAVQDKITLNSGEIYFGEIVVKTPEMVMIKTEKGTRYQFQLSEIKKIEKGTLSELSVKTNKNQETNKTVNFCGNMELSVGVSKAKNSFGWSPTTEFSLIFGNKNVSGKNIFLGAGIGYNLTFLSSTTNPIPILPIFLRFQDTLTGERTAPFIGIDAGYAFGLNSDFGGGPLVKLSVGISHKTGYKSDIYAGIYAGVTSISSKITETNDLGIFTYTGQTSMTSLGLKFGFHF